MYEYCEWIFLSYVYEHMYICANMVATELYCKYIANVHLEKSAQFICKVLKLFSTFTVYRY